MDSTVRIDIALSLCAFLLQCVFNRFSLLDTFVCYLFSRSLQLFAQTGNKFEKKKQNFYILLCIWPRILLHIANAFYKVIKNEDEKKHRETTAAMKWYASRPE